MDRDILADYHEEKRWERPSKYEEKMVHIHERDLNIGTFKEFTDFVLQTLKTRNEKSAKQLSKLIGRISDHLSKADRFGDYDQALRNVFLEITGTEIIQGLITQFINRRNLQFPLDLRDPKTAKYTQFIANEWAKSVWGDED